MTTSCIGPVSTIISLLAVSTILLACATSTCANPVPRSAADNFEESLPSSAAEYFEDTVYDSLSRHVPDNLEDPLKFSNPQSYSSKFTRHICDVVAYSELARTLQTRTELENTTTPHNQTAELPQGMFSTDMVNMTNYYQFLSIITQTTCNWIKQLVNATTPRIVADPPFTNTSCSPDSDGVTYLHHYCFSMRILNDTRGLLRDANFVARDIVTRLDPTNDITELI